jgi:hypothetical protein
VAILADPDADDGQVVEIIERAEGEFVETPPAEDASEPAEVQAAEVEAEQS